MKKVILLIVLFISTAFYSSAQIGYSLNIRAGLPALTGDDYVYDTNLSIGAALSFGVEYPFTDIFSVQGDLGYALDRINYSEGSFAYSQFWHEIELRAFAKAKRQIKNFLPYIKLGPVFSMVVAAESQLKTDKQDIKPDNPLTVGIGVELGIELDNSPGKNYEIGLMFQRDLTKFNNNSELYRTTFGISFSILF